MRRETGSADDPAQTERSLFRIDIAVNFCNHLLKAASFKEDRRFTSASGS